MRLALTHCWLTRQPLQERPCPTTASGNPSEQQPSAPLHPTSPVLYSCAVFTRAAAVVVPLHLPLPRSSANQPSSLSSRALCSRTQHDQLAACSGLLSRRSPCTALPGAPHTQPLGTTGACCHTLCCPCQPMRGHCNPTNEAPTLTHTHRSLAKNNIHSLCPVPCPSFTSVFLPTQMSLPMSQFSFPPPEKPAPTHATLDPQLAALCGAGRGGCCPSGLHASPRQPLAHPCSTDILCGPLAT